MTLEITEQFIPFDQWLEIVPRNDDSQQYRQRRFYDYYRTKFEIALRAKPQNICEIGVRWGYSAFSFLAAAPAALYIGYDILAGTHGGIRQTDTFAYAMDFLQEYFPQAQIVLIHEDTQQIQSLPGRFDLIHIDADHSEKASRHDIKMAIEACKPEGLILVDDYRYIAGVNRAVNFAVRDMKEVIDRFEIQESLRGEALIWKK